jgi:hypothetical protein
MMRRACCLTLLAGVVLAADACHAGRDDAAELALAAAATDSLTVALADSISPGFVAYQAGASLESLSACDDHVDSAGWESVGSGVVDMELPPGFTGASQTGPIANWNGPGGWIRASAHSGDAHSGWTGLITSECEVFISGSPTHIDLVTTTYGRGVHALIRLRNGPAIGIEAQSKSIGGQAQLLHAIRYARVSSAWGR